MHSSRPLRDGSPPAALPALLRATHLLGLALGSALGRLRETGATVARMFERAEESALLLRMMREATEILAARWDKVPERRVRTTDPSSGSESCASGVSSGCRSARRPRCSEFRRRRSLGGRWRR